MHWLRDLRSVLYADIIRRKKLTPFIIAVSFIISFTVARLTIIYGPQWLRLFISQYHIHHFYYGFLLMAISNWIALTTDRRHMFNIAAALFGVGLGLFLDEFGLLLTCTTPALSCDYFAQNTYDAVIFVLGIFFAILYSAPMISLVRRIFGRIGRIFMSKYGGGEIPRAK